MSVKRESRVGVCAPKSVPYAATSASRRSSSVGSLSCSTSRLPQHDAVGPAAFGSVDRTDAPALAAGADHGLVAHLDLADDPAGRGVEARELDAGDLAHHAAPAVAADEVAGSQRRAVGQLDVDAVVVLIEPDDLPAAEHRDAELVDPRREDALGVALPEREHVVVAGREVADVERDVGVADSRMGLALGEEPLGHAPLVEHLDRADVQTAGARAVEVLGRSPFDDDDVGAGQRQLGRQHQARRTATGDHHRMRRSKDLQPSPPPGVVLARSAAKSGRHPQHDPVVCGKTPSLAVRFEWRKKRGPSTPAPAR